MIASHISLRDDFQVSNESLDLIVDSSINAPGCYGARMTGAGFGGCAVALVETKHTEKFIRKVKNNYKILTGKSASIYVCKAINGATVFSKNELITY